MTTIKAYACMGNTDTTEGRGPMNIVCYAYTREVANKIVKLQEFQGRYGVMGTPCDPSHHVRETFIHILDAPEQYDELTFEKEKAEALKKLTDRERAILGLTN